MKVTATRPTYVETENGEKLLKKGESADVDASIYGSKHPFIKAGYLVAEQGSQDDADDDQEHRQELMDAIEQATGKRPGSNTKTETLEKRLAEIEAADQDEDVGEQNEEQEPEA